MGNVIQDDILGISIYEKFSRIYIGASSKLPSHRFDRGNLADKARSMRLPVSNFRQPKAPLR